jgi:hypothetical protein
MTIRTTTTTKIQKIYTKNTYKWLYSSFPRNFKQQQQQQRQQTRFTDNFDTRSVISEPPISRTVVYKDINDAPATTIRKYKTTKTTTTTTTTAS